MTVPSSTAERAGLVRWAAMPKSSTSLPKSTWSTDVSSTTGILDSLLSAEIERATSAPLMPGIW